MPQLLWQRTATPSSLQQAEGADRARRCADYVFFVSCRWGFRLMMDDDWGGKKELNGVFFSFLGGMSTIIILFSRNMIILLSIYQTAAAVQLGIITHRSIGWAPSHACICRWDNSVPQQVLRTCHF